MNNYRRSLKIIIFIVKGRIVILLVRLKKVKIKNMVFFIDHMKHYIVEIFLMGFLTERES
jgi:hypothetical protein